jgi:hypothetical protein
MKTIRTEYAAHQAFSAAQSTRDDWRAVLSKRDAKRVTVRAAVCPSTSINFALLTALQVVGAVFAVAMLCACV